MLHSFNVKYRAHFLADSNNSLPYKFSHHHIPHSTPPHRSAPQRLSAVGHCGKAVWGTAMRSRTEAPAEGAEMHPAEQGIDQRQE